MEKYTKTVNYYVSFGSKEEFYTLWKEVRIDTNSELSENNGFPTGFCHWYFVQNLSKTKEGAIAKVKKLGINLPDERFDFELKHNSRPSIEAFGAKLKFKKDKWYAEATKEFFDAWKENKKELKAMGWSCWKYERNNYKVWYMCIKPNYDVL